MDGRGAMGMEELRDGKGKRLEGYVRVEELDGRWDEDWKGRDHL